MSVHVWLSVNLPFRPPVSDIFLCRGCSSVPRSDTTTIDGITAEAMLMTIREKGRDTPFVRGVSPLFFFFTVRLATGHDMDRKVMRGGGMFFEYRTQFSLFFSCFQSLSSFFAIVTEGLKFHLSGCSTVSSCYECFARRYFVEPLLDPVRYERAPGFMSHVMCRLRTKASFACRWYEKKYYWNLRAQGDY